MKFFREEEQQKEVDEEEDNSSEDENLPLKDRLQKIMLQKRKRDLE